VQLKDNNKKLKIMFTKETKVKITCAKCGKPFTSTVEWMMTKGTNTCKKCKGVKQSIEDITEADFIAEMANRNINFELVA
jgi:peptide subunit release factor 1 (eRF1)